MMVPSLSGPSLREARGLRFIVILIAGWMLMRLLVIWLPASLLSASIPAVTRHRLVAKQHSRLSAPSATAASRATVASRMAMLPALHVKSAMQTAGATATYIPASPKRETGRAEVLRQSMTNQWMANPHHQSKAPGSEVATSVPGFQSDTDFTTVKAPHSWTAQSLTGWSLGSWIYMRNGANARNQVPLSPQLGASQAGALLSFRFGAKGRLRVFARTAVATGDIAQSEVALGLAFAPVTHVPIQIAVERRAAIGRRGRNAFTARISGGVSEVALPQRFRLEAYGAAGVAGLHRRDGFADGTLSMTHDLGSLMHLRLRGGGFVAGAIQPGAARIDFGPRLQVQVPQIGKGSRIAVDWRLRVAGNARPGSGVAMTLMSDF